MSILCCYMQGIYLIFYFRFLTMTSLRYLNQHYEKQAESSTIQIKNYSIFLHDQIGFGCSSNVFKGLNNTLNQFVAIKVIDLKRLKTTIEKSLLESQKNIIRLLIQRKPKGVTRYYQIIQNPTHLYIIMQYEEGGSLEQVLQNRKLPADEVKMLLVQIICSYIRLRQNKIVHRDLKPANILLDNRGNVKLADFGFSVLQQQETKKYKYCLGSAAFSSPQSLEYFEYGVKSDIWALGIMAYKMLSMTVPWKAKSNNDLILKIKQNPINTLLQNINDSTLANFITDCCTVQASQRIGLKELRNYVDIFETELYQCIMDRELHMQNSEYQGINSAKIGENQQTFKDSNQNNFNEFYSLFQQEIFTSH